GTILAGTNSTVELQNDTVTGGLISLAGTGASQVASTTATLAIEGTVSLASGTTTTLSNSINNQIIGIADELTGVTPTLNNAGTIQGAGTIGGGGLVVNNSGVIDANDSGEASELVLNTLALIGNAGGTLEATGGGTLEIDSSVTNTGGTILAGTNSTVELQNDTVTGGLISLAGTGASQVASTTATLAIEGTVSLASGTTTTLSNSINNQIIGIADELTGVTPTLNNAGTIQGAGTIGGGGLVVNNSGVIDANDSGEASELVLNTLALIGNAGGTLEATGGGTLEIDSSVTNTGGTILAGTNSTVELQNDTVTGGLISLAGTGASQVASTTATLAIEGTVSLASGTTTTLSNSINNQIIGIADELTGVTPTLNNAGTIQGAGTIGGGGLVVNNSGVIDANDSGEASELVLNTPALLGNAGGPLEATGGGTLEIDSSVTNTGGTILAGTHSHAAPHNH